MSIPYLHTAETKLILQVSSDLDRHEGFRMYAYPDPLSPIGRKYRGPAWPWGNVPARTLLARIKDVNEKGGAPWTNGFGFTDKVFPDSTITRIQAQRKLESLTLAIDTALHNNLSWYDDASFVTKTVMINMVFNLGLRSFLGFRNSLALLKVKKYADAAHNLSLSLWYKQVGSRAKELVNRIYTQQIEPQHKAPERIC